MPEVQIDPVCLGKQSDLDDQGCCRICNLNIQCKIIDDEFRDVDEKLVWYWIRQRRKHILLKMRALLSYGAQMYEDTKIKTVFVSMHSSIYDLVHSRAVQALPASMLLDHPEMDGMTGRYQIRKKESQCQPHSEFLYWILLCQPIPKNKKKTSETRKDGEVPLLMHHVDEEGNPCAEDEEDDGGEEEADQLQPDTIVRYYGTAALLNLEGAKALLVQQQQQSDGETSNTETVPWCYRCLDPVATSDMIELPCSHIYHRSCLGTKSCIHCPSEDKDDKEKKKGETPGGERDNEEKKDNQDNPAFDYDMGVAVRETGERECSICLFCGFDTPLGVRLCSSCSV